MNDDNDNRRAYHDDVDDVDYVRVPDLYTWMAVLPIARYLCGSWASYLIRYAMRNLHIRYLTKLN